MEFYAGLFFVSWGSSLFYQASINLHASLSLFVVLLKNRGISKFHSKFHNVVITSGGNHNSVKKFTTGSRIFTMLYTDLYEIRSRYNPCLVYGCSLKQKKIHMLYHKEPGRGKMPSFPTAFSRLPKRVQVFAFLLQLGRITQLNTLATTIQMCVSFLFKRIRPGDFSLCVPPCQAALPSL